MPLTRTLTRAAASAAALVVLAAVAVAASPRPDALEAPTARETSSPNGPLSTGGFDDVLDDEAADPDGGGEDAPASDDTASTTGGGGAPASDEVIPFTPRTPETTAQVQAEVMAYRAARGLTTGPDQPNGTCVWGPGGTIFPGMASASESLGAALIRRLPSAVGYQGPAGSSTVVLVIADSFIDSAGVEHPGQVASIAVKHCFPPTPPGPAPSPSTPSSPPSTPPTEPSAPPTEPSTPPGDPAPAPTP